MLLFCSGFSSSADHLGTTAQCDGGGGAKSGVRVPGCERSSAVHSVAQTLQHQRLVRTSHRSLRRRRSRTLLIVRSPLAGCLIYARPLRPDRWLVSARFVDSWRPFRMLVWVVLLFLKTMYHSTIYHSNLSDQSALEIGLGLGLDSELHYFSIFHGE